MGYFRICFAPPVVSTTTKKNFLKQKEDREKLPPGMVCGGLRVDDALRHDILQNLHQRQRLQEHEADPHDSTGPALQDIQTTQGSMRVPGIKCVLYARTSRFLSRFFFFFSLSMSVCLCYSKKLHISDNATTNV